MRVLLISFLISLNTFADFREFKFLRESEFSIHSVKCGDSYELLDYKELYQLDSNYDYDLKGETVAEVLSSYFARISEFDYARGLLYRDWISHLEPEIKFINGMNFGRSRDHLNFVEWDGCDIQIFAKVINPNKNTKSVFIDSKIWNKLSVRDKAGFYINYALNLEHIFANRMNHTEYSRYTNALLASNQFSKLKTKDYIPLYRLLRFEQIFYKNIWFVLGFNSTDRTNAFEINSEGDVIIGTFGSGGFFIFEQLKLKSRIDFLNAKGFDLDLNYVQGSYGGVYGSKETFFIRNVRLRETSSCLGRFNLKTLKHFTVKVNVKAGRHYIESITGPILFNGSKVLKIENLNGVWTAIIDRDPRSFSNYDREVGICK